MSAKFVVLCVMLIIATFILSCFLMTTVNPPRLKDERVKATTPASGRRRGSGNPSRVDSSSERGNDGVVAMKSNGSEEPQKQSQANELSSNPLHSLTPFYRFKFANLTTGLNNTTLDDEDDTEPLFNFPPEVIKIVIPPTMSTTSQEVMTTQLYPTQEANMAKESLKTDTVPLTSPVDLASPAPEKVLRRSVNNFFNKVTDGNSSSVIMKIIDKSGQPRIEIKINTDYSEINKDALNIRPDLEMIVQKDDGRNETGVLGYNTEIKILPNDTVIIGNNNNYLLDGVNVISRDIIEKGTKTTNEFVTVTFPITKSSRTDINNYEKEMTRDELDTNSVYEPNFGVKNEITMKSHAINSTYITDLINSTKPGVDATSKMNNAFKENTLQSPSKSKDDVRDDKKNSNFGIVKDVENIYNNFKKGIGEKNTPIEIISSNTTSSMKDLSLDTVGKVNKTRQQEKATTNKRFSSVSAASMNTTNQDSNFNKSIPLNKESTTLRTRSTLSSNPTKSTHSYDLKVLFKN